MFYADVTRKCVHVCIMVECMFLAVQPFHILLRLCQLFSHRKAGRERINEIFFNTT